MDKKSNVYLEQFKKIPFYQLHPSYIPFVGDNYEKYRILQISESHYCEEITDRNKYGILYFVDWFTSDSDDIETKYLDHDLTRKVCNGVMENNSFANFDNPLRSFCEVVLGLGKLSMNKGNQNRKYYSYFSFMNLFLSGACT